MGSGVVISHTGTMLSSSVVTDSKSTDNAYFVLPVIFVNFVNIKQELLRYAVTRCRISPVWVFCCLRNCELS